MIIDIPSTEEFDAAAKAQFDFAWDIVISFLLVVDDAGEYTDTEIQEEDRAAYWRSANQRILTSVIVLQQGVELSMKARVSEISPYLLIAGSSSDWPKSRGGEGVSFSEFRTIDAQDLVGTYNTVAAEELPEEFVQLYEQLRKLRNKIMHSVDNRLVVSAHEVIVSILELHHYLYPEESWTVVRREFLGNSPATHLYHDNEHFEYPVIREFLTVFEFLSPSEINRFFGISKKQRLYVCPECHAEAQDYSEIEPFYAVLRPNEPNSNQLFCFVCNGLHTITRESCVQDECPGNVISNDYGVCCTCLTDQ